MENNKHKIGDIVKVKSLSWYNKNKGCFGDVIEKNVDVMFISSMAKLCGRKFRIWSIDKTYKTYFLEDLNGVPISFHWHDFMLEDNIPTISISIK